LIILKKKPEQKQKGFASFGVFGMGGIGGMGKMMEGLEKKYKDQAHERSSR